MNVTGVARGPGAPAVETHVEATFGFANSAAMARASWDFEADAFEESASKLQSLMTGVRGCERGSVVKRMSFDMAPPLRMTCRDPWKSPKYSKNVPHFKKSIKSYEILPKNAFYSRQSSLN